MADSTHYGQVGRKAGEKGAPIKGRGAVSNPKNRYEPKTTEAFDDGWGTLDDLAREPSKVQTIALDESSRTIISSNRSPDLPFNQSINPYRGCEHGCIYCYARPSHAYWDLSPGLDFETKIITKPNAAELLRAALSKRNYQASPILIGANTDPYQPLEAKLGTTRSIIEVLAEFKHPFSIITKGKLITRDLDLLAPLAAQRLFAAAVSVTTLDNHTKRALEPRAASGKERLATISALTEAGVPVTLMAAPMIPYINDQELETLLTEGRKAGAISANYILLRLPLEISEMFQEWLAAHYPDRASRVMGIVRQSRGGKDYSSRFGERMRGTGHFAELLEQRFRLTARKLGFGTDARNQLDTSQFSPPGQQLQLL